jgi:hypothetical protein
MPHTVHSRTLVRALSIVGDHERLRQRLDVSATQLDKWIQGLSRPPDAVFLRAVDIIAEHEASEERRLHRLEVKMGNELARCPSCDTTFFGSAVPEIEVNNRTQLFCLSCGFEIARGDLVVHLSSDVAKQGAARVIAAKRMLSAAKSRAQTGGTPPKENETSETKDPHESAGEG